MNIVFFAIIKLFFIILLGFYLYRKQLLKEESLQFLTFFLINISIPCLFFSTIINTFNPQNNPNIMTFILLSFAVFAVGIATGFVFSLFSPKSIRREFLGLTAFHNGGYLPMNLALFLFPPVLRDKFLVYIFLFLLGFNVLMWSIGSFLIFKQRDQPFHLRSLFTAPVMGTLIALIFVYSGLKQYIPEVIITPMKILGEISFPFSMIILGAWLAKSRIPRNFTEFLPLINISIVRLILVPAAFLLLALRLDFAPLLGLFIVIEASMPSAASMPIVANIHKANSEFASQVVFFTHLVALITVPLWIELYLKITGFTF